MLNKELLDIIKSQGEGVIMLKKDYKVILEQAKKEASENNKQYDYSVINSIVFDGVNTVKIVYADYPTDNEDFLKRYTNLRNVILSLDDINSLKFID